MNYEQFIQGYLNKKGLIKSRLNFKFIDTEAGKLWKNITCRTGDLPSTGKYSFPVEHAYFPRVIL